MAWLAGAAAAAGTALSSAAGAAASGIGSAASGLGGLAQGAAQGIGNMFSGGGGGAAAPASGGAMPMGGGMASGGGMGLADLPDMGGMGGQLFGSSGTSQPGFGNLPMGSPGGLTTQPVGQPPSGTTFLKNLQSQVSTDMNNFTSTGKDFGGAMKNLFTDPSGANFQEALGQGMKLRSMIDTMRTSYGVGSGSRQQPSMTFPVIQAQSQGNTIASDIANVAQATGAKFKSPTGVELSPTRGLATRQLATSPLMDQILRQVSANRARSAYRFA